MKKDLRTKLKLIHIEMHREWANILWGLKVILFATKEEGYCPRGFGFLIHKDTDIWSTWEYGPEVGYELILLFRPFPPLQFKWAVLR